MANKDIINHVKNNDSKKYYLKGIINLHGAVTYDQLYDIVRKDYVNVNYDELLENIKKCIKCVTN